MAPLRLVSSSQPPGQSLPRLVVRLGLRDDALLEAFEGFGTPVVARTLAQAASAPGLGSRARWRYGLELLIDLDTWRNELPVENRGVGFNASAVSLPKRLNLSHGQLGHAEQDAYVRTCLAEQNRLQASIFTTPHHLAAGPESFVRRFDLVLARRTVQHFQNLRLWEPAPGDRFRKHRSLYATLIVSPRDLRDPLDRITLARMYRDLEVDGYLVKVVGFSETAPSTAVEAVAEFLLLLEWTARRPVIAFGVKNLGLPLVAEGLASTLLGIGEGETFHTRVGGRPTFPRPVWSSTLLRSLPGRTRDNGPALRTEIAFAHYPCDCGHHPSSSAPANEIERKGHTLSCRLRDFLAVDAAANPTEAFRRRVRSADRAAQVLGLPASPDSYLAIATIAARLRSRIDRAALEG